ncbi:PhzF family phenazine biosynthesis protein [Sandarakinorhabdus sp.]|uniref:PhzF family phenazine biosynthesis protein n=1 Tax=Sandarakinorhabdus sp. TaxID=1916663 RepID=UPI00333FFE2B
MRISLVQVDAFAAGPFTGNPAAVMMVPHWLPDAVLQGIAADNNLSETAFLVPCETGTAHFELRWFTPQTEVELCGHATLASGHVVLEALQDLAEVRFQTRRAGVLAVARAQSGYDLLLPAAPVDRAVTGSAALAAALGAQPAEVHARGHDHLVAVFESPDEVRALRPDFQAMKALAAPDIDLMVIATAPGEATDILSRVFVPACGIDEDPVTGSAHAVLAPFWAARLGRNVFTAEQASQRGGRMTCQLAGSSVILTGQARTVIRGEYDLPDTALPG